VTSVLFVCLGNICRSPTAHGVFRTKVADAGLANLIRVDSCGTGGWHIGASPDKRSMAAAESAGYDLSDLRARRVQRDDFGQFDYILAMDRQNLADLEQLCPPEYSGHLGLFLDFGSHGDVQEVPDPYYGDGDGFQQVLSLVENASDGLLEEIRRGRPLA